MACAQCLATGENYVLREDTSAPGGNRTPDLDVRTVLLYPLSYEGVARPGESLPSRLPTPLFPINAPLPNPPPLTGGGRIFNSQRPLRVLTGLFKARAPPLGTWKTPPPTPRES